MKKYLYVLLVSTFLMQACSKDNSLGLNSETKEDSTSSSAGLHPNAGVYTQSLAGASEGWIMEYEGHKFWFTFEENGIVNCDSDFTQMPLDAIFTITSSGDDAILNIIGGGHFRYLPEGKKYPTFVIESLTNDAISLSLLSSPETAVVTKKAASEDIAEFKAKLFFVKLNSENAISGVLREGEDFLMHYTIDRDNNKIHFSYVTSTQAEHASRDFVQGDMNISWTTGFPIETTDVMFTGITYSEERFKVEALYTSVSNTEIKVTGNSHVMPHFIPDGRQYAITAGANGTNVGSTEIANEFKNYLTNGSQGIELNYAWLQRSFVAVLAEGKGYIFYHAMPAESSFSDLNTNLDQITFTNLGGVPLFNATPDNLVTTNTQLEEFLASYFHEDGFYVIPQGNGFWLLMSTTQNYWISAKQK